MVSTLPILVASPFTPNACRCVFYVPNKRHIFECKGTDELQFTSLIEFHKIEMQGWHFVYLTYMPRPVLHLFPTW